jgi:hypothetical protein
MSRDCVCVCVCKSVCWYGYLSQDSSLRKWSDDIDGELGPDIDWTLPLFGFSVGDPLNGPLTSNLKLQVQLFIWEAGTCFSYVV